MISLSFIYCIKWSQILTVLLLLKNNAEYTKNSLHISKKIKNIKIYLIKYIKDIKISLAGRLWWRRGGVAGPWSAYGHLNPKCSTAHKP